MNEKKLNKHLKKECLKNIIDNNHAYTDKQKQDLKLIVDAGETPEEILEGILSYFAFQ